jgi:glycosyltransferase involved in cell wall biosynthesis
MPVFNERETVEEAVAQLESSSPTEGDFEIILVDDASTDGSLAILDRLSRDSDRIRLVRHDRNRGKGAAIRSGIEQAEGDWTTIMDADLEYDPLDIDKLLEPLIAGNADAAFGARGFEAHSSFSFWYVLGNKGVTFAANFLFNSWLSDIMTCHKAMATERFRALSLREDGFAIEPEIAARLLQSGAQIHEVPVNYAARSREAGKKLTVVDGFRVLRTLVRCRLRDPRRA